ncbi:DNA methylase [Thermosporothrix hazakensis]|uniref:Methyltransferase n=2 Tax=Thermosporothrix TaxID=768650 RepID=A0A326U055_THEHA|nr:DNA methyltransferase [Thermosporothrix hazakensis]PZW23426.1 DNA methylase [Thermosporothrix hazakensis]BBH89772.1 methyltransferase [Thermosporothrix sp. COM3]GCE47961.1 methyltransferase [Thermosporothrix hazakensis]
MDNSNISARNTLNELTGAEWLYFTKSIHTTSYPSAYGHKLRKQHGANKPPQLMCQLIEFFTKPGARVLDPFAGVGGTLIGASICKKPRQAIGIEINPKWIEIYQHVLTESEGTLLPQQMLCGDCLKLMQDMESASFDFIATDPPYNIHLEQTMSNTRYAANHANRRTDYDMRSDHPADLANLPDYEAYLDAMGQVFAECYRLLKPQKYMVVIVRNAYQRGEYIFTHVDLARRARRYGFIPKGEIIWYQVGTRLRPYGYPVAYIPNIAHQYIVVLYKPKEQH